MNEFVPNIQWHWDLYHPSGHFTRVFVDDKDGQLRLSMFTTIYPIMPIPVDLPLNQLSQLTTAEAMNLYNQLIKENPQIEYPEAALTTKEDELEKVRKTLAEGVSKNG